MLVGIGGILYLELIFFGIVHPMLVIVVGIWYFQPKTTLYSYIFVKKKP